MKKNLKIMSIIIVLMLSFVLMPMKVFASGDFNIPVIDEEPTPIEGQGTGEAGDLTTGTDSVEPESTDEVADDKVAEDKVADDKVLPDAGFDQRMIYIIGALIIFAVFAYFKVVKYNLD